MEVYNENFFFIWSLSYSHHIPAKCVMRIIVFFIFEILRNLVMTFTKIALFFFPFTSWNAIITSIWWLVRYQIQNMLIMSSALKITWLDFNKMPFFYNDVLCIPPQYVNWNTVMHFLNYRNYLAPYISKSITVSVS